MLERRHPVAPARAGRLAARAGGRPPRRGPNDDPPRSASPPGPSGGPAGRGWTLGGRPAPDLLARGGEPGAGDQDGGLPQEEEVGGP